MPSLSDVGWVKIDKDSADKNSNLSNRLTPWHMKKIAGFLSEWPFLGSIILHDLPALPAWQCCKYKCHGLDKYSNTSEEIFPPKRQALASQPAVNWQKLFQHHQKCWKWTETKLRWHYMYVGGLICQHFVDMSLFESSQVTQRFCRRSQRVAATVSLFVKSDV